MFTFLYVLRISFTNMNFWNYDEQRIAFLDQVTVVYYFKNKITYNYNKKIKKKGDQVYVCLFSRLIHYGPEVL